MSEERSTHDLFFRLDHERVRMVDGVAGRCHSDFTGGMFRSGQFVWGFPRRNLLGQGRISSRDRSTFNLGLPPSLLPKEATLY
jgi:hypothetical protein